MALRRILQQAGYGVRAANSGARALKMLEREPPDLMLLDINTSVNVVLDVFGYLQQ